MTDYERTILEHYKLPTPYPVEWPAEKDLSDGSDADDDDNSRALRLQEMKKRRSRFSALERVASDRRSLVPGSQKTDNGMENMVQRDEPDPLGSTDSVVRVLRQLGLPIQEDPVLRLYTLIIRRVIPNKDQVIDSSCPLRHFLRPYSSPKSTRMHLRRTSFKAWMYCQDPLIRSPLR
jgi:hypothetical protein